MGMQANVHLFECDNAIEAWDKHDGENPATTRVDSAAEMPAGWLSVKLAAASHPLTFCSLRCAITRLRAIEDFERSEAVPVAVGQ